ncbi:OmpA family protein [Asanoa sp. WMMD1127]|nr:OmpA family protein [Asanoa sp. WMMD1127]MDG4821686.1 OmpA family protein [Asanoa sp. WMMD1127]
MPTAPPVADVPIGSGPLAALPDQRDPAATSLAPPRILNATSVAEGVDTSVNDEGGDRTVRLASDVLFAIDRADLSPRADALLQQVAGQIDASDDSTVAVDGHADSTGTDAINDPLSQRRAQTVADRLTALVTRPGVTYQVKGHGSRSPIFSNDTAEGRRKNRRVTVTFSRAKPKPAQTTVAGTPYRFGAGAQAGADFTPADVKGLRAEVNGLHRDSTGLTSLVWTLRNDGQTRIAFGAELEKEYFTHGSWRPRRGWAAGGVMLVDPAAHIRYEPMYVASGACLCSATSANGANDTLEPGESVVLWELYKTTPETRTVEIQVPWKSDAKAAHVTGLSIG